MALSHSLRKSALVIGYFNLLFFIEKYLGPLLFFTIRVWIAIIFWDSGLCKVQSWPTTLMLFKNEYKVPTLSPEIAAYLATVTELSCPILLALGLATRLAAIPMLVMTTVIQCTYLCTNEHLYWAVLLGLLICYGPGQLSLDFFFRKWILRKGNGWKSF